MSDDELLDRDPMFVLTEHIARLTEQVSRLVEHVGGAPTPALMTCAQVANLFGVSEDWVRNAARTHRIPCRRLGSKYRFTQADVDEAIESARRVGNDPFVLNPRQVAAINRARRDRLARGSGRVKPVPGLDFTNASYAVVYCPGVGAVVTDDTGGREEMRSLGYVPCPHCGSEVKARALASDPGIRRMTKHSLRIPRAELTPGHKPWNRNQPYAF